MTFVTSVLRVPMFDGVEFSLLFPSGVYAEVRAAPNSDVVSVEKLISGKIGEIGSSAAGSPSVDGLKG